MTTAENVNNDEYSNQDLSKAQKENTMCLKVYHTCLINEVFVDRATILEQLNELLDFNENILRITKEFWENMAKIAKIKDDIHDPQKCYSFLNLENCVSINKFSYDLFKPYYEIQGRYKNMRSIDNLNDLKQELLNVLNDYLEKILPVFNNEINNLEIRITTFDEHDKHETALITYVNSEHDVENQIIRYLEDIRNIVSNFDFKLQNNQNSPLKLKIENELKETYDNVTSRLISFGVKEYLNNPNSVFQQEITSIPDNFEITQNMVKDDFNTIIPFNTDTVSRTEAFLTDKTDRTSENAFPLTINFAILFVILGSLFAYMLLRRRKRNIRRRREENDYDLL
ncbi:hypothetical protein NBO_167g0001 [Nosema bombycis CQ1]|uniref:Uncharacterized protein n=1 Tax=Nosema bombycis (strain CQ1 / CVCC 102059) TaxID=578461 RepID=R0MG69_NOSB1|nr:hypothetical protein NBO_167g0001 [Nosema bombycis CQ1]|eukprot:EOB13130.1 hypothetical protein NBO_167g0001 [Nosema bombycis CQ1]